jgi:hypothetical protein
VSRPFRFLTAELTADSEHFVSTFKAVVEHIHDHVMTRGRRRRYAKTALEILLLLTRKTPVPLVDAVWINGLLESSARGNMDDNAFTVFLELSARREDPTADVGTLPSEDHAHGGVDPQSPGGIGSSETRNLEHPLFAKISQDIQTRSKEEGGWQDDALYGGLIAMEDIPQLGACRPDDDFLETLSRAMKSEKGEKSEENKPLRVRKAAYGVILAARDEWLRSPELHKKLEELDLPRQLHNVVLETGRSDYQRSFLMMMEILSKDRNWHPYLRRSMNIWLPLRHGGPDNVLRIFSNVSDIPLPEYDGSNPPLDNFLEKLVEDEWAGVPGRPTTDLTTDRLEPLVEVTTRSKELLFTEGGRKAVLAAVEQVIPSLERRRDDGYEGPGEDIRGVVDSLQEMLRTPMPLKPAKASIFKLPRAPKVPGSSLERTYRSLASTSQT